jgi:universal stress protein E
MEIKQKYTIDLQKQNSLNKKKGNMNLLGKILLATDFSESSDNVIENAVELAKTFQSKIILLHVLPDDIKNEKAKQLLNQAATAQLKSVTEKINSAGVETEKSILEYGHHFDKINQVADTVNANIILVGSGEKMEKDAYKLGTTAEKIIQKSNKPVWVVKKDMPLSVKNILCPVDFSTESKRALENAIILARRFKAKLTIFSVYENYYSSSLRSKVNWEELNEFASSDHMNELDSFLGNFNLTDLDWQKEIIGGNPATEILEAISRNQSDLLIMGTTGKSGLSRFLMGSVTEKVIRGVPCSFITQKSEGFIDLKLESKIRDIKSHFDVAKQLMKDGFFEESINEYNICLSINDMHVPSLFGISKVYEKIGNVEMAKKYNSMAKEILSQIWDRKIESEIRKFYQL